MSAMGRLLQQAMEQMRQRQGQQGAGSTPAPAFQPGISPNQQAFMQRYGGMENVTMEGGGPQQIPQSWGNQWAGQTGYMQRMQPYTQPPQQSAASIFAGANYGPKGFRGTPGGRTMGGREIPTQPPDPMGGFGQVDYSKPGDRGGGMMTRGGGDPYGSFGARFARGMAGRMGGGLRQMMQERRQARLRNQPRQGRRGGTLGSSKRGRRRNQRQQPIKGGILGGSKSGGLLGGSTNSGPVKQMQRGSFEGVLR